MEGAKSPIGRTFPQDQFEDHISEEHLRPEQVEGGEGLKVLTGKDQ